MKIYDTTNIAIFEPFVDDVKKAVVGIFDERFLSVMLIEPDIIVEKDPDGEEKIVGAKLKISEPDGAERLYWLEKFDMITQEEYDAESSKLDLKEKRKLFEKLKIELGE